MIEIIIQHIKGRKNIINGVDENEKNNKNGYVNNCKGVLI
jgi:hypothetical protein